MIVRHYWQPFQEFNTVKQQLDQLFDDFAKAETAPTTWTPAVTLIENQDALLLHVQLPGVDTESLDIQASREVVAISGDRTAPEFAEGTRVRRNEFRYGAFRRVVSLPVAIDPKQVTANYESGILVLTLPKAEDERNKVVKVSIAGAAEKPAIAEANRSEANGTEANGTETAAAEANPANAQ
jgi:HSP20 family protein